MPENNEQINAEKFLESEGLLMSNISLICFVDGFQRQPSIIYLLEKYAKIKNGK